MRTEVFSVLESELINLQICLHWKETWRIISMAEKDRLIGIEHCLTCRKVPGVEGKHLGACFSSFKLIDCSS